MEKRKHNEDAELNQLLERALKEGRLADLIVDLLASAAVPEILINGEPVALAAAPQIPISDKSCYKKCLKDSLGKPDPDAFYGKCIKGCKPKTNLSFEIRY